MFNWKQSIILYLDNSISSVLFFFCLVFLTNGCFLLHSSLHLFEKHGITKELRVVLTRTPTRSSASSSSLNTQVDFILYCSVVIWVTFLFQVNSNVCCFFSPHQDVSLTKGKLENELHSMSPTGAATSPPAKGKRARDRYQSFWYRPKYWQHIELFQI